MSYGKKQNTDKQSTKQRNLYHLNDNEMKLIGALDLRIT
jgi:hypothetical protein